MREGKRWEPTGFAQRLRAIREAAGLTQHQLAEQAGCFPLTVSKLERGAQEPAWPLVITLAKALGVSCEAFLPTVGAPPVVEELPRPRGRPKKQPVATGRATGPAKRARRS